MLRCSLPSLPAKLYLFEAGMFVRAPRASPPTCYEAAELLRQLKRQ